MDERHADRIARRRAQRRGFGARRDAGDLHRGVRWEGGWEPDALEGALRAALAG